MSHLLEYMAFKTTKSRTHLRLVREVEAIGGNVLASGEQAAGGVGGPTQTSGHNGPWCRAAVQGISSAQRGRESCCRRLHA